MQSSRGDGFRNMSMRKFGDLEQQPINMVDRAHTEP